MTSGWAAVLARSLTDLRRPVAAWATGVSAIVLLESALWPTVRDMPRLDDLLAGYPEALTEAFGLDAMSTGPGFLEAELFSLVLPGLFIAFAVTWGTRTFAGEEESGALGPVLASPLSRAAVCTAKAAALLLALATLGLVVAVVTTVTSGIFGTGVGPARAAVGALALVLLGGELGLLALAVGAASGRRAVALATATVVAVGSYVLYVAALVVDALADVAAWTPYDQALRAGPLTPRVPGSFAWLVLVGGLVLLAALPALRRRDLRA
ncbi:ABC transporter permease subunit [Nocardioides sp. AX2bis]|uniref:ABC transporter permease subunit n=1 Tax=Nocardioides sp. AX2bis TaxID=2653157 RepID=UPI0012F185C3|nr:ABC transporter permease subunit [Nocardioides sp. AX2bis]VXC46866.1 ABC-2 type transport system permease protein [Nocardioides sp. AX2bis]